MIAAALDARRARLAENRPPYTPVPLAEIGARLEAMLRAHVPGPFTVHDLQPLTGGASKQHFVFELEQSTPSGPQRRSLVLRTALAECLGTPPSFQREAEVQRALASVVPVASVVCVDAEGKDFGAPAIVLGRVPGTPAPPEAAGRPSGLGMLFSPERRAVLGPAFLSSLARIHAFADAEASRTLTSFERPAAGTTEASAGVLAWWRRVWDDDAVEPEPMMEVAIDWLEQNLPVTEKIALVHGDYRAGNFLFDPATNEITAILDWELARFGDRHEDLGWTLSNINTATDDDGTQFVCGLERRDRFLARYEELSGLPIDPERLFFYEVFNQMKIVVIALAIGPRNVSAGQSHAQLSNIVFAPLGWASLKRLHALLGPRIA